MIQFEVGKTYVGLDFFGRDNKYLCVKRTKSTVTLFDELYNENFVKKIKCTSKYEYVVFSKQFMGYAEMEITAKSLEKGEHYD